MWALLKAFLKNLGKAATKGGKLAVKGVMKGGELAAKKALQPIESLYNAFKGTGGNTPAELKGTAFDPEKYGIEKTPQPQVIGTAGGQGMGGAGQGIGGIIGQSGVGENRPQDVVITQKPSIIPSQYQQFTRQPGMQYVPGPEGSVIGGQGEVMPGYGMQSPQSRIPPAYLQYGQQPMQQGNQQAPMPGFIRGFTENLLGMPQTEALQRPDISTGRKTAYYAGGLIPNIIMSKLGQPSAAEAAGQQQQLEKQPTPEYKKDLQEAVTRLGNPKLSEADKIMIYQQLVTVYPERSAEIKRIIFPQSNDNFDDLLKGIIAGNMYGR